MTNDEWGVAIAAISVALTALGMAGGIAALIYRAVVKGHAEAELAQRSALDTRIGASEQELKKHHERIKSLEANMATRADVDQLEERQRADTQRIEHKIDANKTEVLSAIGELEKRLFNLVETLWKKAAGSGP